MFLAKKNPVGMFQRGYNGVTITQKCALHYPQEVRGSQQQVREA